MDKINQLVAISDKYIVVLAVLFIIFIGISIALIHISKQIKK
jgi:hypothetical protein